MKQSIVQIHAGRPTDKDMLVINELVGKGYRGAFNIPKGVCWHVGEPPVIETNIDDNDIKQTFNESHGS